jgi:hypothetical protein
MDQRYSPSNDSSDPLDSPASLTAAYHLHTRNKQGSFNTNRRERQERETHRESNLANIRTVESNNSQMQLALQPSKVKTFRNESVGTRLLDAFIPTANASERLDPRTRWGFTSQELDVAFPTRKWARELHSTPDVSCIVLEMPSRNSSARASIFERSEQLMRRAYEFKVSQEMVHRKVAVGLTWGACMNAWNATAAFANAYLDMAMLDVDNPIVMQSSAYCEAEQRHQARVLSHAHAVTHPRETLIAVKNDFVQRFRDAHTFYERGDYFGSSVEAGKLLSDVVPIGLGLAKAGFTFGQAAWKGARYSSRELLHSSSNVFRLRELNPELLPRAESVVQQLERPILWSPFIVEQAASLGRSAGTSVVSAWERYSAKAASGFERKVLHESENVFTAWPPNNRIQHEAMKTLYRQNMEMPVVMDPDLAKTIARLYREQGSVGSGSTADAIRFEIATGRKVKDKFHLQKGTETLKRVKKWLDRNSNANPCDRAAAENVILDLKDALGNNLKHGDRKWYSQTKPPQ